MAVAGCINAYDCAGCFLTTFQQLQSDNIGVAINYTAPSEYWRRQLDYIKYTDKCGCTCCLTGENELKIVATQWVIKNFTLTNDDTNEKVIVKWNDLFGSNRAYTMVRYKTWSYPTSISDWTLAVKETTQNQYSVSWYNVSGLTDWTTYYFTAFAVSQDGTIIVVQNKNITTDFKFAGYTRLEYIYGSWMQWINTWITPTQNTKSQFWVMFLWRNGRVVFWLYYWNNDNNDYRMFNAYWNPSALYTNNPWRPIFDFSSSRLEWVNGTRSLNVKYEFEMWNYYLKYVGASSNIINWWTISSYTWPTTIKLDWNDTNSNLIWSNRWYYVKIWDWNTLVRDMYPVKRKSDNKVWLLDIANNKTFYSSIWSQDYLAWPNI